jgi:hypothetical protein
LFGLIDLLFEFFHAAFIGSVTVEFAIEGFTVSRDLAEAPFGIPCVGFVKFHDGAGAGFFKVGGDEGGSAVLGGFGAHFDDAFLFRAAEVLVLYLLFELCCVVEEFTDDGLHFEKVAEVEKGSGAVVTIKGSAIDLGEIGGAFGEGFFQGGSEPGGRLCCEQRRKECEDQGEGRSHGGEVNILLKRLLGKFAGV